MESKIEEWLKECRKYEYNYYDSFEYEKELVPQSYSREEDKREVKE